MKRFKQNIQKFKR